MEDKRTQKQYDVAIILGHTWTWFGPSSRQKKRMDKAVSLWKDNLFKRVITTGGWGLFNLNKLSLGELTKQYLIKHGITEKNILTEGKSINTYQNIKFALEIIQKNEFRSVIIITSIDHMGRAKKIVNEMFPQSIERVFVISDYFSGIWSLIDFIWQNAAWIKYYCKKLLKAQ